MSNPSLVGTGEAPGLRGPSLVWPIRALGLVDDWFGPWTAGRFMVPTILNTSLIILFTNIPKHTINTPNLPSAPTT